MPEDREALRATFDEDAVRYDRARPTYPAALFDEIDRRLTAPGTPRVLEIGCGTGQATLPLARRGYQVLAVELGADMARVAAANLDGFDRVRVVTADVETWAPEQAGDFDLVVSATAFHWLDPATRLPLAAALLRPGGLLALVQTIHVAGPSDDFFADAQTCYERWDPDTPRGLRLPHLADLPAASTYGIEHAEEFVSPEVHRFPVDHRYTAEQYLDLLGTFSNHRALPSALRDGLFACLRRRIASEPDQTVVRSVAFELSTARRA